MASKFAHKIARNVRKIVGRIWPQSNRIESNQIESNRSESQISNARNSIQLEDSQPIEGSRFRRSILWQLLLPLLGRKREDDFFLSQTNKRVRIFGRHSRNQIKLSKSTHTHKPIIIIYYLGSSCCYELASKVSASETKRSTQIETFNCADQILCRL